MNDIRRNDLVKLKKNLNGKDRERIETFAKHISKQDEMYDYADLFIDEMVDGEQESSKVWKCDKTKKGTEYAFLTSRNGVHVPIQSRYLILVHRKPSHPLTNVFQD